MEEENEWIIIFFLKRWQMDGIHTFKVYEKAGFPTPYGGGLPVFNCSVWKTKSLDEEKVGREEERDR